MQRRESGLLVFSPKFKAKERIVTLPDGRRVREWVDESGTVKQVEENDRLHAIVVPKPVVVKRRSQ